MHETGPVKDFEKIMSDDLMGYGPIIDRWLKARFPSIYSKATAFDCHSAGMLDILERGYTGMNTSERQHIIFKRAVEHVGDVYKNIQLPEKLSEGYYTRESVDFSKLDPEFINSLPLTRRRVWKMRCEGKKAREIARVLKTTVNNICVCCYSLRKAYVKWYSERKVSPMVVEFSKIPSNKYYHEVARRRLVEKQAIPFIAQDLGISPLYVSVVLWKVREALGLIKR